MCCSCMPTTRALREEIRCDRFADHIRGEGGISDISGTQNPEEVVWTPAHGFVQRGTEHVAGSI
jgi:hypothetical protein